MHFHLFKSLGAAVLLWKRLRLPENLMNHDKEQLEVQSEALSDFKFIEMLKKISFLM